MAYSFCIYSHLHRVHTEYPQLYYIHSRSVVICSCSPGTSCTSHAGAAQPTHSLLSSSYTQRFPCLVLTTICFPWLFIPSLPPGSCFEDPEMLQDAFPVAMNVETLSFPSPSSHELRWYTNNSGSSVFTHHHPKLSSSLYPALPHSPLYQQSHPNPISRKPPAPVGTILGNMDNHCLYSVPKKIIHKEF